MKKLTGKQAILTLVAGLLFAYSMVFDGAPASFFAILIAVVIAAYVVHTLPRIYKNESNR